MKRYLSALTVFWVMFLQIAYADFDYSGMKESANDKTGFFTINEDQDSNNSYITADIFSISERSFDHKYHSDDYYSNFENDWIIFDYNSEKATPLRRLWIDISSKSALNISSVTFSFNNNVCTFSGFLRPHVDITQYKNGDYLQSICLIMGNNSIDFHDALREYIYSKNDTSYETIMSMENIKMTLHGTEDIEVELPNTFLLDFLFTDWIFSDEDYPAVIKMSKIPTTFNIKTNNEFNSSDILPLGNNEDFAIRTNGSYVYNTASSDLSGYETTDKWLFNYDDNLTCIVHGYTESADISYYPTDDNSKLSSWELIKRCFELAFYENANIFKDPITIRRDGSKLIVTSVDDLVEGNIYYAYTFVILKNGIVHIASNSTGNDNAIHFVAEIAGSILSKDENDFITNIIP